MEDTDKELFRQELRVINEHKGNYFTSGVVQRLHSGMTIEDIIDEAKSLPNNNEHVQSVEEACEFAKQYFPNLITEVKK